MNDTFFENPQIDIDTIPNSADIAFVELERSYFKVSLIGSALFSAIFFIPATVLTVQNVFPGYNYIFFLIATVIAIFIIFMTIKGFKHKGYALRWHDVIYKSGYIWRSQTVVPFNRIQHCEVDQGPIERIYGLASLKIFTAGGSSSDIEIPGLQPSSANSIKDYIMGKIPADEEE